MVTVCRTECVLTVCPSPHRPVRMLPPQSTMTPENVEKYAWMKDDPDLVKVFDDVKVHGPAAFEKVSQQGRACRG